jgi:hypothetical protein
MNILLTILLALYPTMFAYQTIPLSWMKAINDLSKSGTSAYFLIHLIVFGAIFFIIYSSFKKFISLGFLGGSKRGVLAVTLLTIFTVAVALIGFYNVLPGSILYNAPVFLNKYLLVNPFTFLWLFVPFIYLFFD